MSGPATAPMGKKFLSSLEPHWEDNTVDVCLGVESIGDVLSRLHTIDRNPHREKLEDIARLKRLLIYHLSKRGVSVDPEGLIDLKRCRENVRAEVETWFDANVRSLYIKD
jgi:hypothetical protein